MEEHELNPKFTAHKHDVSEISKKVQAQHIGPSLSELKGKKRKSAATIIRNIAFYLGILEVFMAAGAYYCPLPAELEGNRDILFGVFVGWAGILLFVALAVWVGQKLHRSEA